MSAFQQYYLMVFLSIILFGCKKEKTAAIAAHPKYTKSLGGVRKWKYLHKRHCASCTPPIYISNESVLNFGLRILDDSTIYDSTLQLGGVMRVAQVDSVNGVIIYKGVIKKELSLTHYFLNDSILYAIYYYYSPYTTVDTCVTIK